MENENQILAKLTQIAEKIDEQNMLQKAVLNFNEACKYLDVSPSHLYKLTSQKQIPHFCPQGKKLYFRRDEIDSWLLRNRQSAADEIDKLATDYIIRNKRG
jgi:excisionase family DNA binding protein